MKYYSEKMLLTVLVVMLLFLLIALQIERARKIAKLQQSRDALRIIEEKINEPIAEFDKYFPMPRVKIPTTTSLVFINPALTGNRVSR